MIDWPIKRRQDILTIHSLFFLYHRIDLRKMSQGNRIISGGDCSPSGDSHVREIRDNVDAPWADAGRVFKIVVYTSADLQLSGIISYISKDRQSLFSPDILLNCSTLLSAAWEKYILRWNIEIISCKYESLQQGWQIL